MTTLDKLEAIYDKQNALEADKATGEALDRLMELCGVPKTATLEDLDRAAGMVSYKRDPTRCEKLVPDVTITADMTRSAEYEKARAAFDSPERPTIMEVATRKAARDAAKAINFGNPIIVGHLRPDDPDPEKIDGLDRFVIFNRFGMMQREEEPFRQCMARGDQWLTPKQIEVARTMWSAGLRLETMRAAREDASREPSVRCQSAEHDDLENL